MRVRSLLLIVALVVAACGGPSPTPSPSPTPATSEAPAVATADDGPFRLTLTLPRATWSASETITGQAMLTLTAGDTVTLSGSGQGPLGFGFVEVGGTRQMGPASTADCVRHELAATTPTVSAIVKSGGFDADGPDAAFYNWFFANPGVQLPAGTWDLTAYASFVEGPGCRGASHEMTATVRLTITP